MTLHNVSFSEQEWISIYINLVWAWEERDQEDQELGYILTEIEKQLSFLCTL